MLNGTDFEMKYEDRKMKKNSFFSWISVATCKRIYCEHKIAFLRPFFPFCIEFSSFFLSKTAGVFGIYITQKSFLRQE